MDRLSRPGLSNGSCPGSYLQFLVFAILRELHTVDTAPVIPNLPEGDFTMVRATWGYTSPAPGYFSFDDCPLPAGKKMQVLGVYHHTSYKTVLEEECVGGYTGYCFWEHEPAPICSVYRENSMRLSSMDALKLNGSGITIPAYKLQTTTVCFPEHIPEGACTEGNTFPKVLTIRGACGGAVLADETVAVHRDHPYLHCNDRVYIHGRGVKTVVDRCPYCGDLNYHHIDHYVGVSGCSRVPGNADLMTIRLHD